VCVCVGVCTACISSSVRINVPSDERISSLTCAVSRDVLSVYEFGGVCECERECECECECDITWNSKANHHHNNVQIVPSIKHITISLSHTHDLHTHTHTYQRERERARERARAYELIVYYTIIGYSNGVYEEY